MKSGSVICVAIVCAWFAFSAGYAMSGCWVCSQRVRFDCSTLGVKTIAGQCQFVGVQWDCDFTNSRKKYWCRLQINSECTKTR